jgi:hypothetical protein
MNPLQLLIDLAILALLVAAWLYFLREAVRHSSHLRPRELHMTPELWVASALTALAVVYYIYTRVRPGQS